MIIMSNDNKSKRSEFLRELREFTSFNSRCKLNILNTSTRLDDVLTNCDYYDLGRLGYLVGFKAFDLVDGKLVCRDKIYEVGNMYKLSDESEDGLELCSNGYHLCLSPWDTYKYYSHYDKDDNDENRPIILLVVATGAIQYDHDCTTLGIPKLVTDEIYITDHYLDPKSSTGAMINSISTYYTYHNYKDTNNLNHLLGKIFTTGSMSYVKQSTSLSYNYDPYLPSYIKLDELTDLRSYMINRSIKLVPGADYDYNISRRYVTDNPSVVTTNDELDKLLRDVSVLGAYEVLHQVVIDLIMWMDKYDTRTKSLFDKLVQMLRKLPTGIDLFSIRLNTYANNTNLKELIPVDVLVRFWSLYSISFDSLATDEFTSKELTNIYIESLDPTRNRLPVKIHSCITYEQFKRMINKVGSDEAYSSQFTSKDDSRIKDYFIRLIKDGYIDQLAGLTEYYSYHDWIDNIDEVLKHLNNPYGLVLMQKSPRLLEVLRDRVINQVGADEYNKLYRYVGGFNNE